MHTRKRKYMHTHTHIQAQIYTNAHTYALVRARSCVLEQKLKQVLGLLHRNM